MPTNTINLTGQALSKTDDTNVTLTLGGTPLTALLKATSLTLGWTGTLADARITSAATWNAKESALTFSTGLTRTVNTITIDNTVVTLTGAQALSNKTGNISQWTNDSGYLTSLAGAVTSVTGSGNIASSGGSTPNITFTGTLPIANGGTALSTLGTANQQLRVNAGATALEYFTPTGSGITVGTTTITSGTSRRIPYNLAGIYQEAANELYFETASPFAHVFAAGRTGIITGVNNSFFGYSAGLVNTSGADNVYMGFNAGKALTNLSKNVIIGSNAVPVSNSLSESVMIGYNSCVPMTSAGLQSVGVGAYTYDGGSSGSNYSVAVGYDAIGGEGANSYCTSLGHSSGNQFRIVSYCTTLGYNANAVSNSAYTSSIAIGANAIFTASNQGVLGAANANGYISNWYFNGVTHTAAYATTLNACGGSGTNNAGAAFTIAGGKSTGSAAGGSLLFQTSTTLGSGTTLQTLATRLTISGGAATTGASTATWADALDFVFGSTTGTKIGTATTQKIGFWNATPIVQLTTAVGSATFASPGGGTSIKTDDTFDGYTLQQVVKALRNLGILA